MISYLITCVKESRDKNKDGLTDIKFVLTPNYTH